jgi:hypothetical protein
MARSRCDGRRSHRPEGCACPQRTLPSTAVISAGEPRFPAAAPAPNAATSTTPPPGRPGRPAATTSAACAATTTGSATRHRAGPCTGSPTAAWNGPPLTATGSPPTHRATAPTTTCHPRHPDPPRDGTGRRTSRSGNACSADRPHPRNKGTTHRPSEPRAWAPEDGARRRPAKTAREDGGQSLVNDTAPATPRGNDRRRGDAPDRGRPGESDRQARQTARPSPGSLGRAR